MSEATFGAGQADMSHLDSAVEQARPWVDFVVLGAMLGPIVADVLVTDWLNWRDQIDVASGLAAAAVGAATFAVIAVIWRAVHRR